MNWERLPAVIFLSVSGGVVLFMALGLVVFIWANAGYGAGMTLVMIYVGVVSGGAVLGGARL